MNKTIRKNEVKLSKEFKRQAIKSIFSICFFVFTYLIVLGLAFLLTGLCVAAGIGLIAARPMAITIALGIGLVGFGVLILIFLVKFMFKTHKTDRSHLLEITRTQEPNLFAMIDDIVSHVKTSFPKRVYLSAEVNAAVFYDSSFWSMFLPVRKNLQIGLGLVNTVTQEELKAILAHEFGHFSQRTMKVGSYVYNVNQVIFNMLFDNESYDKLTQRWASMSGSFSVFVGLALKVNAGIQWILKKLYEVVNISYLGLSREMEFHADEIAASITGYQPLKKSLLRSTLADTSYTTVLNYYNNIISENKKSNNIYDDQFAIIRFLSQYNALTVTNNLPDISLEEQSKYDKSKLVIKDQWASHPSLEERIARLEKTNFTRHNENGMPANSIFSKIADLQKQLTERLFKNVTYQGSVQTIPSETFIAGYEQQALSNSFGKCYNGYYDHKNPAHFELNESADINFSPEELFSDQKVGLVYSALALQNDIQTLKNIAHGNTSIKTYDYDGVRYKKKDADELAEKLESELLTVNEKIKKNDAAIYNYFLTLEKAQNRTPKLELLYKEFFAFDKLFDIKFDIYNRLSNALSFVNVTTPLEDIVSNLKGIKPTEEELKLEISQILLDDTLSNEITKEIRESLEKYNSRNWTYFDGTSYHDNILSILFTAMHNYSFLLSRKYFIIKKALLTYQEELRSKPEPAGQLSQTA